MTAYWLYLLSDPETHEPRYVGLTQNPANRAMWHKSRPRKTNSPGLDAWFAELRAKDLRPEFSELACISGDDDETVTDIARKAERTCIMNYGHSKGMNFGHAKKGRLLNIDWNKFLQELKHPDINVRMIAEPSNHILPSQDPIVT